MSAVPAPAAHSERFTQLDGLRGLAALSVFLLHVVETGNWRLGEHGFTPWQLLQPLWDGEAAVVLFFVLSGFVLALPYTGSGGRSIDTIPFILRRLFRLYPAYWLALAVALTLRHTVFSPAGLNGLSVWINIIWQGPFPWRTLPGHIVLILHGVDTFRIDPVVWSLAAEIKVSLIYPAVLLLLKRCRSPYWIPPILAASMFCDFRLHAMGHLTLFLFGGFLALYRRPVLQKMRQSRPLRLALVPVAYFLFGVGCFHLNVAQTYLDQVAAVGATLWIVLFLSSNTLHKLGCSAPVHFLGQVSYSFYLLHLPILITVTSLLYPRTGSLWLVAGVALALSLSCSWAAYKFVELPTHDWGRAAGKAWEQFRAERVVHKPELATSPACPNDELTGS